MKRVLRDRELAYERLKDAIPYLVDEDIGVISYIQELPRQFDMPEFHYYKAGLSNTEIFGLQPNRPTSGGTALDRDRAMAKAIGEAVERYCSAIFFPDEMILNTYAALECPAVHPSRFNIHAQGKQPMHCPHAVFDEQTLVRWVWAKHWSSGTSILLPAGAVYCPYSADRKNGEASVMETISTGIAAHCSFEEAAVNGILEVVERDSFMMHWLARIPCRVIAEETLGILHHRMLEKFARHGYRVQILYASSDSGIPTVICLMYGEFPGAVPLTVSAATHLNPAAAVTKALEELALLERLSKRLMINHTPSTLTDFSGVRRLIDHLKFWLNPKMVPEVGFLISPEKPVVLSDLPDLSAGSPDAELTLLVRRIEAQSYPVYLCDLTTEDIRSLGLHVVRAVVPGYLPLTINYGCRPEGAPRLLQYLEAHQIQSGELRSINPIPHPFA